MTKLQAILNRIRSSMQVLFSEDVGPAVKERDREQRCAWANTAISLNLCFLPGKIILDDKIFGVVDGVQIEILNRDDFDIQKIVSEIHVSCRLNYPASLNLEPSEVLADYDYSVEIFGHIARGLSDEERLGCEVTAKELVPRFNKVF